MSKTNCKVKAAQAELKELEKQHDAIVAKIRAIAAREVKSVAELAELASTLKAGLFRVKARSWRKYCGLGLFPYTYQTMNSLANYHDNDKVRKVLATRGVGHAKQLYSVTSADMHPSTIRSVYNAIMAKSDDGFTNGHDAIKALVAKKHENAVDKATEEKRKVVQANVSPEAIKEARERSAIVTSAIAVLDKEIAERQAARKELASELEELSFLL